MPDLTFSNAGYTQTFINSNDNFVPFIVGEAYGSAGGDAPTTVQKITSFSDYKDTFGWSETDPDTPGTDYNLEGAAWVIFQKYQQAPVLMLNVYNSSDHAAGVGDVAAADIVGGLDEIEQCLTKYGLPPAMIAAPGWSDDATVRAAIQADTSCYNGTLSVLAVIDGDDAVTDPSTVATTAGAITDQNCAFVWPDHYDLPASNWYVGAAMKACNDADKGDQIPFWPPSNVSTNQAYSDNDTRVTKEDAATLNDAGVTTFQLKPGSSVPDLMNHRLLYYNAGEDDYLKDTYAPQMISNYLDRVMFSFLYEKLSAPVNIRQINSVLTALNTLLENLKARGAVVGAKVEFLESDNTTAELADGDVTFRITYLPPKEIEDLTVTKSIDLSYTSNLFS